YFLFSLLNLDHVFKLCIFSALAAGALAILAERKGKLTLGCFIAVGLATCLAPPFIKERFSSAVRRTEPTASSFQGPKAFQASLLHPERDVEFKYLFYDDGPDSSVAIVEESVRGKETSR